MDRQTKFDADYCAMLGKRVSCAAVAALCEPLIKRAGELPEEGLLPHAYEALSAGLYPYSGSPRSNKGQKIALKIYLAVLSRLMDAEREKHMIRCWTMRLCRRRSWKRARSRRNARSLPRR
jgi:hypothetical protein